MPPAICDRVVHDSPLSVCAPLPRRRCRSDPNVWLYAQSTGLRHLAACASDYYGGPLAPQLLEPVELARLGREDVHDDVEVVHQDPTGLRRALNPPWQRAVLA